MPNSKIRKKQVEKKHLPYIKPPISTLNKILLLGIMAFILAGVTFFFSGGANIFFWLLIVLGIILVPNAILLRFDFAQVFLLKYVITMIKTKKMVSFIESLSHHAKWFEKICLIGSIFGFGLVGVDYWLARKIGGWKRILVLVISALALGAFFYIFCSILFAVPALAPLFTFCLIAFILLGFGGMSLAILVGYGLLSVQSLFTQTQLCPSVAPVLPGVPIPGLGVPIPLIAWVSLAMVLIIHEFSHGIMMAYYKEKIKSVGLILAGIFPMGAFVEQDDKTFEKLDDKKALLVLSAGSASNLFTMCLAWVFLLMLTLALTPFSATFESEFAKTYSGVKVNSVQDKVSYCGVEAIAPAKGKLFSGDEIKVLNGVDINNITTLNKIFVSSKGDFNFTVSRVVDNTPTDVNVSLTPFVFEQLGIKRIGVEFAAIPTGYIIPPIIFWAQSVLSIISQILLFFIVISFAAGTFNYFPSDPFDGGRMSKIMITPYLGFLKMNKSDTQKLIGRVFMWILIVSLVLNMIPYLTMF
jgi:membrane-associated protease RseP (regulator of RpoE activity)